MIPVVLACSDLFTSSRLELVEGLAVRVVRARTAVESALEASPDATLVVDLPTFPQLLEELAAAGRLPSGGVVAFAPHVHEDLLEAARAHAHVVAPRGAAMRALGNQVERARTRAKGSPDAPDVAESAT